jgi:hypothetical protein
MAFLAAKEVGDGDEPAVALEDEVLREHDGEVLLVTHVSSRAPHHPHNNFLATTAAPHQYVKTKQKSVSLNPHHRSFFSSGS